MEMMYVDLSVARTTYEKMMREMTDTIEIKRLEHKLRRGKKETKLTLLQQKIDENPVFKNLKVQIIRGAIVITAALNNPLVANALDLDRIKHSLDPMIDALQALGYPVALLAITGGCLVMTFNKRLGIKIIRDAAIAFLLLQFVPGLMGILVEVGRAFRG